MSENTNVENVLKNELTIKFGPDEFRFKIPSVKDRLLIAATAAKLRKDNDPDSNGIALGYDPTALVLSDKIATFMVLLKGSSAKWVYTPGPTGPYIDIDKWPDNVPVMEVVDQFNDELETFRKGGDQHQESSVPKTVEGIQSA